MTYSAILTRHFFKYFFFFADIVCEGAKHHFAAGCRDSKGEISHIHLAEDPA